MKTTLILLLAAAFAPLLSWGDDAGAIDPSRLRSEVVRDTIDLESDKSEVHRDRAAVRAAKDAFDDAVSASGKDSPEARQAQERLDRAQRALHKDLGDFRADERDAAAAKSHLAGDKSIQELAAKYAVPPSDLEAMRKQGLSWIEIGEAVAISKQSGKPLSEVLKLRQSGLGWGDIARRYGLKPADISKQAREIAKAGEKAEQRVVTARKVTTRRTQSKERGAHGGHGRSARHGH